MRGVFFAGLEARSEKLTCDPVAADECLRRRCLHCQIVTPDQTTTRRFRIPSLLTRLRYATDHAKSRMEALTRDAGQGFFGTVRVARGVRPRLAPLVHDSQAVHQS